MNGFHNKANSKWIKIRAKINEINSYGINKKYNWKDIKSELKNTHRCFSTLFLGNRPLQFSKSKISSILQSLGPSKKTNQKQTKNIF